MLQASESLGLSRVNGGNKVHGGGVHTVAHAGRLRAVIEDMAEMSFALFAGDFGTDHAEAAVRRFVNLVVDRLVKGRPTTAGIVLGLGRKQRCAATLADIGSFLKVVVVFSCVCPLGALLPEDAIFFWGEDSPPFRFRPGNFFYSGFVLFHGRFGSK